MSVTNVTELPSETLLNIFHYLNWNELKISGQVCRAWKAVSHEVSETKWKDLCRKEYGQIYEDAFRKTQISWEDLHKSLRSWSQLSSSKVYFKYSKLLETRYVNSENKEMKLLQFLKNGIIGYPYYIVEDWEPLQFTGEEFHFNTLCYYDANTLKLIDSVNYDFHFDQYQENDDLIVLREDEMQLYIITKSNKRLHRIGEMLHDGDLFDRTRFYLIGNSVFYMTMDHTLWMSRLVIEAGLATIESSVIAPPDVGERLDPIQAVAFIEGKQVNLLTTKGDIFSIIDKELKLLCRIEKQNQNVVIDLLKQHGFFWNTPEVYNWITSSLGMAITHLKGATVQSYGPVVLVGTLQRVLQIYYNPYRKGQLKLNKAKVALRIDLNGWVPTVGAWPRHVADSQRKINQIEVLEIKGGHRIILLYCQRLVAIEIRLDDLKRTSEPRAITAVGARHN